jgi:hypothetical protein
MRQVLAGLAEADVQHPDESLSHERGWCLSVDIGGLPVREGSKDDAAAQGGMRKVSHEEVGGWSASLRRHRGDRDGALAAVTGRTFTAGPCRRIAASW